MSRLDGLLAAIPANRRAPVAGAGAVGIVAVLGLALVANPFGSPGATFRPTNAPTAAQPTPTVAVDPTASVLPSESPPASEAALVPADLDGMLVDPAHAHRLPIFVSIDDARAARPQSGWNATSEVWQSPVDGYESRYLFAFQELDATDVGPTRSARYFFIHWVAELKAGLAHYGWDRTTKQWAQAHMNLFTNLDGIRKANPAFHRIHTRLAPHNAYTSTAALFSIATKLGGSPTIDPAVHLRPFRDDVAAGQFGTIDAISIPYNTETINYRFVPATDSYNRYIGSDPQIDQMDGKQCTARTIVVLYMPFHTDSTINPGHDRPVLGFIGSGKAVVYSEGQAVNATWSKPTEFDPTRILGSDGHELAFVRGRIVFQVVPIGTKVKAG